MIEPGISAVEDSQPEALDDLDFIDASGDGKTSNSLLKQAENSCIRRLIASYKNIPSPIALIDSSLNFFYINSAFQKMLHTFHYPQNASFFNTFSRSFSPENAQDLYRSMRDRETGFSWRGTLTHKTRDLSTMVTTMRVLPYKQDDEEEKKPDTWLILIDDVTKENQLFLHTMFMSLLEASKLKDNDTGVHIERVNLYAKAMAQTIYESSTDPDIDKDFVDNIGFLAAMHDVGKIGTPDDILNKQGPLTEFEWGIMREHTINGAFILSSYPNIMAKQIAQSHHEWWNGTGYPYKLEGEMIPLPARIVALADVYDALRMKRSYKDPFTHEKAFDIIMADSGKHFDPALVLVFKKTLKTFETIFNDNKDFH